MNAAVPPPVPITQLNEAGVGGNPLPAITDYIPISIFNANKFGPGVGGFQTFKISVKNILSPLFGSIPAGAGFGVGFDGGGNPIDASQPSSTRYVPAPFAATIVGVTLLGDRPGNCQVDFRKTTFAQFDAGITHPTGADSICGGNIPAIAGAGVKFSDTTLAGWNTSINKGDILGIKVLASSSFIELTAVLQLLRVPGS